MTQVSAMSQIVLGMPKICPWDKPFRCRHPLKHALWIHSGPTMRTGWEVQVQVQVRGALGARVACCQGTVACCQGACCQGAEACCQGTKACCQGTKACCQGAKACCQGTEPVAKAQEAVAKAQEAAWKATIATKASRRFKKRFEGLKAGFQASRSFRRLPSLFWAARTANSGSGKHQI